MIANRSHGEAISLQAIARLMPATLLIRRRFADLLKPPPDANPPKSDQIEFAYA